MDNQVICLQMHGIQWLALLNSLWPLVFLNTGKGKTSAGRWSLSFVSPSFFPSSAIGNHSCSVGDGTKYNDTDKCWGPIRRIDAYRLYLVSFSNRSDLYFTWPGFWWVEFFPIEVMWCKWTTGVWSFQFSLTLLAKCLFSSVGDMSLFQFGGQQNNPDLKFK